MRWAAKINEPCKAPRVGVPDLHFACTGRCDGDKLRIIQLLLGAGADPNFTAPSGETPLDMVRKKSGANLAVVLQIQDIFVQCSISTTLVKARRLVVCGRGIVPMPSYLRRRVTRGVPLPLVATHASCAAGRGG